jgi:hypothetical protein
MRIFGSDKDEVTGDWRKLHKEELHNLYSAKYEHNARGDEKCRTKLGLESLKGKSHSEDPGVDGRIILKWILREQVRSVWTGFI